MSARTRVQRLEAATTLVVSGRFIMVDGANGTDTPELRAFLRSQGVDVTKADLIVDGGHPRADRLALVQIITPSVTHDQAVVEMSVA